VVDVAGVLEVPGGDGDQDEVRINEGSSGARTAGSIVFFNCGEARLEVERRQGLRVMNSDSDLLRDLSKGKSQKVRQDTESRGKLDSGAGVTCRRRN
jgi:hypothetical protein